MSVRETALEVHASLSYKRPHMHVSYCTLSKSLLYPEFRRGGQNPNSVEEINFICYEFWILWTYPNALMALVEISEIKSKPYYIKIKVKASQRKRNAFHTCNTIIRIIGDHIHIFKILYRKFVFLRRLFRLLVV